MDKMEMTDQTETILACVSNCLVRSTRCIEEVNYEEAKEKCLIGLALIDVIHEQYKEHCGQFIIEGVKQSLQSLLRKSEKQLKKRKSVKNIVSTPDTPFKPHALTDCNFDRIVGCNSAKQCLFENVVLPCKLPFVQYNAIFSGIRRGSCNVLLHGPPGTGKTLLAQACANECDAHFYEVKPSDVLSKYQGESEKYVRRLFDQARGLPSGRAIVFFDEFDSIAQSRGSGSDESSTQSRKLLSELLLQLTQNKQMQYHNRQGGSGNINDDDMSSGVKRKVTTDDDHRSMVVVIAATNRLEDLDEAVLRRFECKIYVGVPDREGREQLVLGYLQGVDYSLTCQDFEIIADLTEGWSGSDIEALCREAAMIPVREILSYSSCGGTALKGVCEKLVPVPRPVKRQDFEKALTELVTQVRAGCDDVVLSV